jgi:hypothetical protein
MIHLLSGICRRVTSEHDVKYMNKINYLFLISVKTSEDDPQ